MAEDEIERIIAATLERHASDPATLAAVIIERLWDAGYEIRSRPDLIPIRLNPSPQNDG
jgi:hypothetical protein